MLVVVELRSITFRLRADCGDGRRERVAEECDDMRRDGRTRARVELYKGDGMLV